MSLQAPVLSLPRESNAPWEGSDAHVNWLLWSLKDLKQKAGSGSEPPLPRGSHPKGPGKEGYSRTLSPWEEESDGY